MVSKRGSKHSKFNPASVFEEALKKIKKDEQRSSGKILDIISFAKEMLDITPFKTQEIILKFTYAGTPHNEDLRITEEDVEVIKGWDLPNPWLLEGEHSKLSILNKNIKNFQTDPANSFFKDVVMVLGRRSGKSFISAMIAVYEAYKLIMVHDPRDQFVGHDGNKLKGELWIINTAVTKDQAKTIIFKSIREMLYDCPLFYGRVGKETEDMIYLLTDYDIEKNIIIKESGGKELPGTIVIACGSSNSPALRGHATVCLDADSLVLTEKGYERISELSNEEGVSPLSVNMLGMNGLHKTKRFIKQSGDIYKVIFSNGNSIKCTMDHKFFTLNDKCDIVEKRLSEIDDEDLLISPVGNGIFSDSNYEFEYLDDEIPHYKFKKYKEKCKICNKEVKQINYNHLKTHNITMKEYKEEFGDFNQEFYNNRIKNIKTKIPKKMNCDLASIIGYLISEGHYSGDIIGFCNTDYDVALDYQEKIENIFGIKIKIIKTKREGCKDIYTCNFGNKSILYFLERNCRFEKE